MLGKAFYVYAALLKEILRQYGGAREISAQFGSIIITDVINRVSEYGTEWRKTFYGS